MYTLPTNPGFVVKRSDGNPQPISVQVKNHVPVRWHVVNNGTSWIKTPVVDGFGNGIFQIGVNVSDSSVVIGTQTGILLLQSRYPTIVMTVTLTVFE